jgi:hypothetical protein
VTLAVAEEVVERPAGFFALGDTILIHGGAVDVDVSVEVPPESSLRLVDAPDLWQVSATASAGAGGEGGQTSGIGGEGAGGEAFEPVPWVMPVLKWEPLPEGELEVYQLERFSPDFNHNYTTVRCTVPLSQGELQLPRVLRDVPPVYGYRGAAYAVMRAGAASGAPSVVAHRVLLSWQTPGAY